MRAVLPDAPAALAARLAAESLAELIPPVAAGEPDGPEWMSGDRAGAEDLGAIMDRLGRARGSSDPRLTGTVLLEHRTWAVAGPAVLSVLRDRRAPDPSARSVALRMDADGTPAGVAFGGPVAVLAGDPWADVPGAVVLADEAALLGWLGARLTDGHLEPVVATLVPLSRRGPWALWASVHDTLSGVFAWIGDAMGQGGEARRLAGLLLGGPPPLDAPPRYRDLVVGDRVVPVRDRIGCCQSFRAGVAACVDCPRTGEQERVHRLR